MDSKIQSRAPQRAEIAAKTPPSIPAIVTDVLKTPGKPLEDGTKRKMESKFARDFSKVRVHDGPLAAASADAIGASAYAFRNDIVLGSTRGVQSARDVRLLTHELSHVVQQEGLEETLPTRISSPSDSSERQATWIESAAGEKHVGAQAGSAAGSEATVHRALPVAAEVLEIALTAIIVAQEQAAISQGGLAIGRETASRFASPPQPKKADYKRQIIFVSRNHPILPNVRADIYIRWSGNDFGEIGGAYIWVDPDHPQFSRSSLTASFTPLNDLPNRGDDPRAWPMQWIYNGRFDPLGAGDYEFDGKFEINAFGGFKILEHTVTDHSTGFVDSPYDYVARGPDVTVKTPPMPPNTKVTIDSGAAKAPPKK